jgi:hypothetical protein
MPGQDYERYRLSKHHTNNFFRTIESRPVPISDFELIQITVPLEMVSKARTISYHWPTTAIRRRNTRSILIIAQLEGERYRLRSELNDEQPEEEFLGRWRREPGCFYSWETVLFLVNVWADRIEAIMERLAADRKRERN